LFVEALSDGAASMPASILFHHYMAMLLSMGHHLSANIFIELVEVSLKE